VAANSHGKWEKGFVAHKARSLVGNRSPFMEMILVEE
jgi:hypothetical protein